MEGFFLVVVTLYCSLQAPDPLGRRSQLTLVEEEGRIDDDNEGEIQKAEISKEKIPTQKSQGKNPEGKQILAHGRCKKDRQDKECNDGVEINQDCLKELTREC